MNCFWNFEFCRGIKEDLKRRYPHYLSDWTDIFTLKIVSSSLFMFFTSMGPAITFSIILLKSTEGEIGKKIDNIVLLLRLSEMYHGFRCS